MTTRDGATDRLLQYRTGSINCKRERIHLLAFIAARGGGAFAVAKLQLLLGALFVFWSAAGRCAEAQEQAAERSSRPLAELAIAKDGAPLIVPVTIETKLPGETAADRKRIYKMLIDTGSGWTVFDTSHRGALGKPISDVAVETPSGVLVGERFNAPQINFGTFGIHIFEEVVCFDLSAASDALGEQIDGVLGIDMLMGCIISVNFDEGKLRFLEAADPSFGKQVPVVMDDARGPGFPKVRAAFDEKSTVLFSIDTGRVSTFAGGLDSVEYAQRLENKELSSALAVAHSEYQFRPFMIETTMDMKLGRAKSFSLGGYKHQNLVFGQYPNSSVGLGYLSRYCVLFDFRNGVMYLRPGKGFNRPELYDLSGLRLSKQNGDVVVGAVVNRSEAAKMGIKSGDILVEIDGDKSKDLTLFAVRQRFCRAGRHMLEIGRDGKRKQLELVLVAEQVERGKSAIGPDKPDRSK